MAIGKQVWDRAKALFMAGESLSSISKKTGISKGQISKRSKRDTWVKDEITDLVIETLDYEVQQIKLNQQKETLNEKKETLKEKKETLSQTERDIYEEVLLTEAQARHLAMNTGQELMKLLLQSAQSNRRQHLVKDGLGMGATQHTIQTTELAPSDIKDLTTSYRSLVGELHPQTQETIDTELVATPDKVEYNTMTAEQIDKILKDRE